LPGNYHFTYLNTKLIEAIIEEILKTASEITIGMATLYVLEHYMRAGN
jgi:hypothetical protein